mmetsp:Transcript_14352/g.18804  ORF Transcript_14352/g.18804 Transcript_14352/m.18804 type:complete len:442 (-) Transcript_14352:281-1606(-)
MNQLKRPAVEEYGGSKRPRDDQGALRPGSTTPTNVCLIRVSNIFYPVTIDALHAIFRRFGTVEKIVMFDKGSGFQALIQYNSVEAAKLAHVTVDMQDMYTNCNTIRVGFSNLTTITVKTNNDRSWDFSTGQLPPPLPPPLLTPQQTPQYAQPSYAPQQMQYGMAHHQMQAVGAPGFTPPPMGMPNMMGMQSNPAAAASMMSVPSSYSRPPVQPPVQPVQTPKPSGWGQPPLTTNVITDAIAAFPTNPSAEWNEPSGSPVIMIQHLDTHHVTPEALAALFGLYGDVMKVKIMDQRESALVQYMFPLQAANAVTFLNGCPLSGKTLRVMRSTSFEIKDSSASDFSSLQIHRYCGIESPSHPSYQQNLIQPTQKLVVNNLPQESTQGDIMRLYSQYGKVSNVVYDQMQNQAVVEMETVEAAVHALIMTHHFKLENCILMVNFTT